jgi:hypothetical protein
MVVFEEYTTCLFQIMAQSISLFQRTIALSYTLHSTTSTKKFGKLGAIVLSLRKISKTPSVISLSQRKASGYLDLNGKASTTRKHASPLA